MLIRKIFRRTLFTLLIVSILTFSTAQAAIKTYNGVGEYFMTDETVDFAKNQAELAAQRDILEKVCVYVKGISTMIDYELDEDEIITIAAGIIHVTETNFSFDTENEFVVVKSFVTATVDTEELKILLDDAIKNRS